MKLNNINKLMTNFVKLPMESSKVILKTINKCALGVFSKISNGVNFLLGKKNIKDMNISVGQHNNLESPLVKEESDSNNIAKDEAEEKLDSMSDNLNIPKPPPMPRGSNVPPPPPMPRGSNVPPPPNSPVNSSSNLNVNKNTDPRAAMLKELADFLEKKGLKPVSEEYKKRPDNSPGKLSSGGDLFEAIARRRKEVEAAGLENYTEGIGKAEVSEDEIKPSNKSPIKGNYRNPGVSNDTGKPKAAPADFLAQIRTNGGKLPSSSTNKGPLFGSQKASGAPADFLSQIRAGVNLNSVGDHKKGKTESKGAGESLVDQIKARQRQGGSKKPFVDPRDAIEKKYKKGASSSFGGLENSPLFKKAQEKANGS